MKQFKKIQNRIVLALLVPALVVLHGFENPADTNESAVKAMFIYNFAKYIDWSRVESKPDFVIAVYGNSTVSKYLDEISHRKTINGKPIVIKIISSARDVPGSQMLFIPENTVHLTETIRAFSHNNAVVIITENMDGFKTGAHINLINVDGKLRFELNESGMKNNNIKFSRELSVLAVKTN